MRYLVFAMVATVAAAYADKPAGPVSSEDEYLVVTASALVDRAEVTKALGYDAGMDLVIVDVKLAPRGENKITVSHDDFTLISRKDGQRSQPLAPSQIAGKGALVVAQGGRGGGGGLFTGSRGPIWGGAPGTGTRPAACWKRWRELPLREPAQPKRRRRSTRARKIKRTRFWRC